MYTDEQVIDAVKASYSTMEVLRKLGIKEAGGSHTYMKKRITQMGLDTSHFKKYQNFLKPGVNKLSWEKVLVKRDQGGRRVAVRLRRALIESGREYKCELCGNCGIWNDKPMILEVDHKNNNWLDDRKENLRFLCPNCHCQCKHSKNKGLTGITKVNYKKNGLVGEQADPLDLESNSEKSASSTLAKAT